MSDYIDISKHQGSMDFAATKAKGVKGVAIRGAYSIYKDTHFDEFYKGAVANGYLPAVYLFTISHYKSVSGNFDRAKAKLIEEINNLLKSLEGKKTEFVALDFELEKNETNCLSKEEMTELANLFADRIKGAGHTPRIYCSISWLFDYMLPEKINCDFWIAYYYQNAKKDSFPPTKWGELMNKVKDKIKLWQYSQTGIGASYGASSPTIDLNYNYSEVKIQPNEKPVDKSVNTTPKQQYKVGDKVLLNGYLYADSYGNTAGQKRNGTTHKITRIVDTKRQAPYLIDNGLGWVRAADIKPANTVTTPTNNAIKVGTTVVVKKGAKTYGNANLQGWVNNQQTKFKVLELKGNRAVIGNEKGEVTAAMRVEDLIKT